ncbi:MAG: Mth938-like domain-containing protein [Chloroflexota bacterium]|nr:Mth938-like domain-containing protein [Chloroflexota bacterium]
MSNPPEIQAYRFGRIVINDVVYNQDVIIFPDRVRSDWQRRGGHHLALEDLVEVLESDPEVIILGKGAFGRIKVSDEVRELMAERGIELVVFRTEGACKAYNELREQRRVIAALHLSC